MCTSLVNAYAGTYEALTDVVAPGENHSITRNPDNRADFTVIGTTATAGFTATACIFEGIRVMTLTSKVTITGGFIQNIGNIVASTATLSEVSISAATLEEGVALLDPLATFSNVANCAFVSSGNGHVARITSTGSTDSDLNTFTGFWAPTISGSNNGWEFHTQTGINLNIITTNAAHGFTTGDAVFYNNEGGTDDINLVDQEKYYVNVASTTTFTVHLTRAAAVGGTSTVVLADGSTGETHAMYSGNATIFNDSADTLTVNVLNDGDTPSIRNGAGASTTVVNTKTLTITCLNTSGLGILGIRVRIEAASDGSLISEGTTNASGIYQDTSYAFTSEVIVNIIARLKGFKFNQASDTIRSTGLSVPFTMIRDPAVDLP
jgi:hypothetical protein